MTDEEKIQILEEEKDLLTADIAMRSQMVEAEAVPLRAEVAAATRLAGLKKSRAEVLTLQVPGAAFIMDQHIRSASRALHAGGRPAAQQHQDSVRSVMDRVVDSMSALRNRKRIQIAKKKKLAHAARLRKRLDRRRTDADGALRREQK